MFVAKQQIFRVIAQPFVVSSVLVIATRVPLLGHAAPLLVGLHRTAAGAKFVETAREQLIFPKLALQRAVVKRQAHAGLKPDLVEALRPGADHPRVVAGERVLEALAQGAVEAEQVGRNEALAVGRICHHERFLLRLLEVLDVALRHLDAIRHAGALGVCQRGLDGAEVQVVTVDLMMELAFGRIIVINTVQQVAVEVFPFLETESLAEHAGINVAGHERSLDQ